MMTAAEYAAGIREHGEAMTLKRTGQANLTVYGKRVGQPTAITLAGNQIVDAFEVRISRAEIAAASWPEPPRNTDQIVIAGRAYSIEAAQQHDDRGVVYGWKLQVTGTP